VRLTPSYPLAGGRKLILAVLLAVASACWVIVARQAAVPGRMSLTMGMNGPVFLAAWVAMMVAMMFPTAAPMILMFARVSAGKKQRGQAFVPTWVFVGAYLVTWTAFGALAYAVAIAAQDLSRHSTWVIDNAARFGGGILVVAGLYQLSPLKNLCLSKCRSPLNFILNGWHDGYVGALRMGLVHGAYCLGCCWALMVVLVLVGLMNLAWMAALALIFLLEKNWSRGVFLTRVVGVALIVLGVAVCLMWFGYINYIRGFGSFRLPSGTPIASLYAAIPFAGALIALFAVEQLVNGIRNGFDHPEPPEDDIDIPPIDATITKRVGL